VTGYTSAVRGWLIAIVGAGAGAWACTRHPARKQPPAPPPDAAPLEQRVDVVDVTSLPPEWPADLGAPPDAKALADRVTGELDKSGLFAIRQKDAPPGVRFRPVKLAIGYRVDVAPPDKAKKQPALGRAMMSIEQSWQDSDEDRPVEEDVICADELAAGEDGRAAAPRLVDCAAGKAIAGLIEKEKVRRGDEQAVVTALASDDPGLRQVALAAVADRRIAGALDALIKLLKSDDPPTRDGALGALMALKDPRAVKPIIDLAPFDDLAMMRLIIDAVGAIGGDEAKSYLELVASGHDVPEIRDLAKQALDRMATRSAAASHH
jgi:hypothetical protein